MTSHELKIRVYYEDTDAQGIVYHGRYLNFAERARVEAIRSEGLKLPQLLKAYDCVFVVYRLTISYQKPLFLDDIVVVKTALKSLKPASLEMEQIFIRDGEVMGKMNIILACVQASTGHVYPIPQTWHTRFAQNLPGHEKA